VSKRDDDFIADLKANPMKPENRLRTAVIERGAGWLAAALFVGDVNKLSDATPDQAETMLAIPEPPPDCDSHTVYRFIHEIREFLHEDSTPPAALDRRTDADLWLCSLVSQVRA
jgi:hypothetical protein